MLAKNPRTPRLPRKRALSFTTFASNLAPTVNLIHLMTCFPNESWLKAFTIRIALTTGNRPVGQPERFYAQGPN